MIGQHALLCGSGLIFVPTLAKAMIATLLERPVGILPRRQGRRRQPMGRDGGARATHLRGTHPIDLSAINALLNVRMGNVQQIQIFSLLSTKLGSKKGIVECDG